MTIRTVFFDVGNTLLTPALSEGEVLMQIAADFGVSVDAALVEQNMLRVWEYYEELYEADNAIWGDEERAVGIWLAMYEYLCKLVEIPEELHAQIARKGYEVFLSPESWMLFDDALPTLSALKSRDITLGLISNWDSSLDSIINGMGLGSYFDTIISSAVVGLYKPQPEIFRLALSETGTKASEAMHVGDHPYADVGGASGVGITPVLIDRGNWYPANDDYIHVQDLRDLLPLVS
jgi:putative hydrolase of the HAD superfamily